MARAAKLIVALFVALACVVFATAVGGGLMDDRAFTPEAKRAAHGG